MLNSTAAQVWSLCDGTRTVESIAEEILTAGLAALWDGSKTARQLTREAVPPINRLLRERAGPPGHRRHRVGARAVRA